MSQIHLYPSLNYNSSTMKIGYRVPYHSYSSVETTILTVMLSSLSIIGSIGNTLVIIVFWSKHESLVSTFYILVLSVVDLVTCLFIIPLTIMMELWSFEACDLLCKTYQFLITSSIPFSAMIMVAIAFDRYFAICHPLSRMGKNAGAVSRVSLPFIIFISFKNVLLRFV
ncbi:hypothetical protein HELRODRAFT_189028 [Helobdella robusta]|uniref:G-protein coupled receptors family 1 profile domain-containing protein n=1 Tax=Helobdella robusta TaxID=6412 RepID=T1FQK6_HELRO|nr:hypothetical protein HELRODRAFT_189028 [Helobdella robusta]ESN99202.1 hypothetical protein HELRODRAFT_189028 [Helobdella robusta]